MWTTVAPGTGSSPRGGGGGGGGGRKGTFCVARSQSVLSPRPGLWRREEGEEWRGGAGSVGQAAPKGQVRRPVGGSPRCAARPGVRPSPSPAASLRVAAIPGPQVPLLISLVLSRRSLGPVSVSDRADPLSCCCFHLHRKFWLVRLFFPFSSVHSPRYGMGLEKRSRVYQAEGWNL